MKMIVTSMVLALMTSCAAPVFAEELCMKTEELDFELISAGWIAMSRGDSSSNNTSHFIWANFERNWMIVRDSEDGQSCVIAVGDRFVMR